MKRGWTVHGEPVDFTAIDQEIKWQRERVQQSNASAYLAGIRRRRRAYVAKWLGFGAFLSWAAWLVWSLEALGGI